MLKGGLPIDFWQLGSFFRAVFSAAAEILNAEIAEVSQRRSPSLQLSSRMEWSAAERRSGTHSSAKTVSIVETDLPAR